MLQQCHTLTSPSAFPAAEELPSPDVGRGSNSKPDFLQLLLLAQKKKPCSVNRNLSVLQMAQQMQYADGNGVGSDAAKTLQAET